MSPVLRPAAQNDGSLLNDLVRDAFTPYLPEISPPPAPLSTDYSRLLEDSRCWIAERDGVATGFVLCRQQGTRLLVHTIAVAPKFQGTGLGRVLLDRAERAARELGCESVDLYTNARMHENIRWYTAAGYEVVRRERQDGHDRVFFRKSVSAAR